MKVGRRQSSHLKDIGAETQLDSDIVIENDCPVRICINSLKPRRQSVLGRRADPRNLRENRNG